MENIKNLEDENINVEWVYFELTCVAVRKHFFFLVIDPSHLSHRFEIQGESKATL